MLNFFQPKAAAPSTAKRKTPELSSPANGKVMPAAKLQKRQPLQQRQVPTSSMEQATSGLHAADRWAAPMVIDLDEPTDPAEHPSCRSAPGGAPFSDKVTPADRQNHGGAAATTASSQQQQQQQNADSSLPSSINPDTGPPSDPGQQQKSSRLDEREDPGHGVVDVMRRSQLGPPLPNGVSRQHADSLIAMGFSQAQASRALLATQGDLPRAINWILQS